MLDHLSPGMWRVLTILANRPAPVGSHTRDGFIAGCTVAALERRGLVDVKDGVTLTPRGRALVWATKKH